MQRNKSEKMMLFLFYLLQVWECIRNHGLRRVAISCKYTHALKNCVRVEVLWGGGGGEGRGLCTLLARRFTVMPSQLSFTRGSNPILAAKSRRNCCLFSSCRQCPGLCALGLARIGFSGCQFTGGSVSLLRYHQTVLTLDFFSGVAPGSFFFGFCR